jgi:hypothetical protein
MEFGVPYFETNPIHGYMMLYGCSAVDRVIMVGIFSRQAAVQAYRGGSKRLIDSGRLRFFGFS